MAHKAFNAISSGLKDAIRHARGEDGRGRLRRIHVPDVDVGRVREKLGLTQADFAVAFGVSIGTVRNWEQGRRRPDGPARALLVVISKSPQTVLEALGVKSHKAA